ncbi:MAG TPA: hypothetical protein K8V56_12630 [Sporosarcina psychrophila]|uniref:Lipoprotein n=1 Tax=Sporosarcina psychrophila TaxID=1476 RepID=A0A921KDE8_SPOPS|nr:hypothetical protein [Sporosarcina psychrophila]
MKKIFMSLSLLFISNLLLMGCSNNEEKLGEMKVKQLTRIDVQAVNNDESYNEAIIITDKDTVDLAKEAFEQINWEQNVKAEMNRREDVKVTLFFNIDENMPENLVEYFIWFNQGNETATIIDRVENAYGTLDKENANTLKKLMLNK